MQEERVLKACDDLEAAVQQYDCEDAAKAAALQTIHSIRTVPCDRRADLKGVQGIAEQLKHEVKWMVDSAGSDWDHDPLRPLYFEVLEALFQSPASL